MKTWSLGYEKSKNKAKGIYVRIGRIPCPALSGEVTFNSKGFTHLVRKGRVPRPRNEQKRRFVLLPHVERIIKNPKARITFEQREIKYKANRHGKDVLITSTAKFWTFHEEVKGCNIRVVIRQIENGQMNFLSVMGDDVQIDNGKKNKKPHT